MEQENDMYIPLNPRGIEPGLSTQTEVNMTKPRHIRPWQSLKKKISKCFIKVVHLIQVNLTDVVQPETFNQLTY